MASPDRVIQAFWILWTVTVGVFGTQGLAFSFFYSPFPGFFSLIFPLDWGTKLGPFFAPLSLRLVGPSVETVFFIDVV